ncbi:MAG: DUF5908 family protein [Pseudomonadota bacterium]
MPVQVNEIVIRAVFTDADDRKPTVGDRAAIDRDEIVAECVEQVLALLDDRKDR